MHVVAYLSVLFPLTCAGPWVNSANVVTDVSRRDCHSGKHLAARVDPEPRLAPAAQPFVLDFAGVIFLRNGSVQRVKRFEPFELSWNEPTQGKVSSHRLAQLRVFNDRHAAVEIKSKDGSVSQVSGVLQAGKGRERSLHDPLAGLTYQVDRFKSVAGRYETIWQFVPWKELDTAVFVGTPGIKSCPVDGRRFPGQYMYSPYTGDALAWEDKPATLMPNCDNCRAFMARLGAACNECPDVRPLGEELTQGMATEPGKAHAGGAPSQTVAKISGTN